MPEEIQDKTAEQGTDKAPGTDTGASTDAKQAEKPKAFTEADVDRRVTQALQTHSEKLKAQWEEERKAAEEKARLEGQGEYKTLHEKELEANAKLTAQVAEMTTRLGEQAEAAKSNEQKVGEFVDAEFEKLKIAPAITDLLVGKPPLERLAWLTKHRQDIVTGRGLPEAAKPDGEKKLTDEQKRENSVGIRKIW